MKLLFYTMTGGGLNSSCLKDARFDALSQE